MPLAPLAASLESLPTFNRVIRHLQVEFTHEQLSVASTRINTAYQELHGKIALPKIKTKRLSGKSPRKYVNLYPADFIPIMIEIIQQYQKELKPKRNRIKIAPTPIKYNTDKEK